VSRGRVVRICLLQLRVMHISDTIGVVVSSSLCPFVSRGSVYETLRTNLPPSMKNSRGDTSRIALFCCGAIAGVVGQTVAYPLDLVRRRMQVQGFSGIQYSYKGGILSTMRQIVREEGVRGLYKGMIPNYVKVVPAVSVSFVVYEQMRKVLDM
jgi:solute carrier family 25 phosphate transporter 23/24/25/41